MTVERQISSGGKWQEIGGLFQRVNAIVRAIASHSNPARLALRARGPVLAIGRQQMGRFPATERCRSAAFQLEFKLHLPGGPYGFPAPGVVAFAAGSAEILVPILLVLGLATRLAALGLLAMTLVVQLTVPDGWPVNVTWAAMAFGIMASGPGGFCSITGSSG